MVRLPKANSDVNAWITLNDFMRTLLGGNDYVNVTLDSNNPPKVEAGSTFAIYDTDTGYTISNDIATGNNVYPKGTNPEYLTSEAIYESANRTFTWGSGEFPAKANSTTYYLFCYGAEDVDATSKGKGLYGATTTAPDLDTLKGGYYKQLTLTGGSTWCRYLASFETDGSGNVQNLVLYRDPWIMKHINELVSAVSIKSITDSDYTILDNDGVIEMTKTTSSGTNTVTLPAAADNTGREITIKLDQQSTGFADYMILALDGSDTIEGDVWQFNGNGDYLTVVSDGVSKWLVLGFQSSYKINGGTGVARNDWTNVTVGSNITLNADSNVTHNLDVTMENLEFDFYISPDGANGSWYRIGDTDRTESSGQNFNFTAKQVDSDSFVLKISLNGVVVWNITTGQREIIAAQSYHYMINVFRKTI